MAARKARPRSSTRTKAAVPARTRSVPPVAPNADLQDVLPDMFLRIFDVLLEAGVPKKQIIDAAVRAAIDRDSVKRVNYTELTDLGTAVIARWHTDPAYMRDGVPAVLPRDGAGASVATLMASIVPQRLREDVIRLLERSPSIRVKFGGSQWECGDKVLRLRGPAATVRVAEVVEIALRTLLTNVGALPGAVAPLDLQCDGYIPDAALPVFMDKASAEMRLSVDDMHQWLDAAEVRGRGKGESCSRTGVMVLGFVMPKRDSKRRR